MVIEESIQRAQIMENESGISPLETREKSLPNDTRDIDKISKENTEVRGRLNKLTST